MKTNKMLPDSSISKVWENFRKMNGIVLTFLSTNWVAQSDGTFTNTVEYEGFTSKEILEVDLYDDDNLTETQISEYDGYITAFNINDGKIVAIANTQPTTNITVLCRGEIVVNGSNGGGGSAKITKITQAAFNALPESVKQSGLYVIIDAKGVSAKDIPYDGSETGLGNNIQEAIDKQNKTLGGFTPIIDETGKITGYKTSVGGADTVFPFTKPSFLSSDWTSKFTSGVSSSLIMNDSCVMMLQNSIPSQQTNYISELWSPFIDITNYNNLKLNVFSRKKSQNTQDYYSPKIYLQSESGSNTRIYLHPQTAYDSSQMKTIDVSLSSYTGKFRLYIHYGGWGSGDNFNNGACICIGQATLS